jgi:hypothetical protein
VTKSEEAYISDDHHQHLSILRYLSRSVGGYDGETNYEKYVVDAVSDASIPSFREPTIEADSLWQIYNDWRVSVLDQGRTSNS